jgi:hypothetical protein
VAKSKGFSSDPRLRERQQKLLELYAEMAPDIGGDPVKDRQAMIVAVERSGIDTRLSRDSAKVAKFLKLWKSDESRAYFCGLWGVAVPENPDPVDLVMRLLHTHAVQEDESWGPRSRSESLSAVNTMVKLFIPAQTSKTLIGHVTPGKIERPETYNQEPVMESRSILPAGTQIAKPTGPTGSDEDDEEDGDDD